MKSKNYKEFSEYLTAAGYKVSETDLKNSKRSKKKPIEHAFPASNEIMKLIAQVYLFEMFDWRLVIKEDDAANAEVWMIENELVE